MKSLMYISHYRKLPRLFDTFNHQSYYGHNIKQKSKAMRVIDYLYIFFVLKYMPNYYYVMGFDTKSRRQFKEYVGEIWNEPFMKKYARLWNGNNTTVRDKLVFKILCQYHGLPVPRNFGLLRNGNIEWSEPDGKKVKKEINSKYIVLKPINSQNGLGVKVISSEDLKKLASLDEIKNETYLLEEKIEQHEVLNRIHPHCLNTVRIITFLRKDGNVDIMAGMLKIGATKLPVDNIGMGGIAIGYDLESGILHKEGIILFCPPEGLIDNRLTTDDQTIKEVLANVAEWKSKYPGKILTRHPISGIKFHNIQIPYWEEVKDIVKRAQKVFHYGKAVAWDVAITAEGPVIIEGNENWSTSITQAVSGPLLTEKNKILFRQYGLEV